MARGSHRWINTKLWNDSFVADLDPSEKLLFVYFLTNDHTNISGIYELPIKVVALETGFELSMVKKILSRLKDKVRHVDGYVIVRNWLKHQELKSVDTRQGVLNSLGELDQIWLSKALSKKLYHIPKEVAEGASRVPPGCRAYLDLYLDSDLDLNLDLIDAPSPPAPVPFDLKKEIEKLEDNNQRHLQIIGLYFKQRKPDIRSKDQLSSAIKRHVKAAKMLEPFDDDQILRGFRKASDVGGWTIETAIKILTK